MQSVIHCSNTIYVSASAQWCLVDLTEIQHPVAFIVRRIVMGFAIQLYCHVLLVTRRSLARTHPDIML